MFRILWKISVVLNNYWIGIYSYFLSFFFKKVGKNIKINSRGNQFTEPWNITIGHNFSTMGYLKIFADNAIVNIGDNCKINSNFTLGASGGHVSIGNDVMI